MATLPTSEENAHKILQIFKYFNIRFGEVLRMNSFTAIAVQKGWRIDDIVNGLEWGLKNGWFEERENGCVMLTEAGFKEM